MQRPTQRPTVKYTPQTFLDAAYQHFVTDKNPRCINVNGLCEYNGTGCFIGFVLTEADANNMYNGDLDIEDDRPTNINHREILSNYFNLQDEKMTSILFQGQSYHDNFSHAADGDFTTYIAKAIEGFRKEYL